MSDNKVAIFESTVIRPGDALILATRSDTVLEESQVERLVNALQERMPSDATVTIIDGFDMVKIENATIHSEPIPLEPDCTGELGCLANMHLRNCEQEKHFWMKCSGNFGIHRPHTHNGGEEGGEVKFYCDGKKHSSLFTYTEISGTKYQDKHCRDNVGTHTPHTWGVYESEWPSYYCDGKTL